MSVVPVGHRHPTATGGPEVTPERPADAAGAGAGVTRPVRVRLMGSHPASVDAVRQRIATPGLVVTDGDDPGRPAAGPPVDLTVVVLPIDTPLTELVARLCTRGAAGRIAVISPPAAITPGALLAVLTAGADGWLTTDLPVDALRRTLIGVAHGEPGLARHHVTHLIAALRRPEPRNLSRRDGSEVVLTDRQHQILSLLAATPVPTTRSMAGRLGVSEGTVRWHLARLTRELQVADRAGLVVLAGALAGGAEVPGGDAHPAASEAGGPVDVDAAPGVGLPAPRSAVDALPVPTGPPPTDPFRAGWAALSTGERTAARLVALGMTNREIATRGELSRHTVDTQVKRAFAKLGVRSRVELTRELLTRGP